eukprot:g7806.t1
MDVDLYYDGDPSPEQIMDIDAEETGHEIRRRIAGQVQAVRRERRPNDPLICELLVPPDLAESTFRLPAVEKILREFLPLEEAVNDLLSPQINWAPPGYKPTDRLVRKAMARLWAIRTDGDGDCLLHAVSLSLWGQHDRTLVLRSLVVEVLQDKPSERILFRIWREGQQRADAAAGDNAAFEMEEDQVVAEWHMLVDAANTPSAYLSSFHAFVLANALRRPILVYGDRFVRGKDGEPYAPSDVRGVYLPTLLAPDMCYKLPIAVGYTCVAVGKVGHFTALVGVERELRHLPLVDEHGDNLPIRYGLTPATVAHPDPEGEAIGDYMVTTPYYTEEGGWIDGLNNTAADAVRVGMAHAAEAAFDRLARAQEEEINRALLASKNGDENLNLPPPPAADGARDADARTAPTAGGGGSGGGGGRNSGDGGNGRQRPKPAPLPPLPPPSPDDPEGMPTSPVVASAAAAEFSGTKTYAREGLVSRSGSNTTDVSDDPTAGSFVNHVDNNVCGGRGGGGTHRSERPAGGADNGSEVGTGAVDPAAAAGSVDRSRGRSRPTSSPANTPAATHLEGPPAVAAAAAAAAGGSAAGGEDTGRGEGGSAVASPPAIGSRLLSAPLGVLSAVGAWATGRGRGSVGSAADAEDAAAAVAGGLDHRSMSGDGGEETPPPSSGGFVDGSSMAAQKDASLSRGTSASQGEETGKGRVDGADARRRRPPDLELDDPPPDVPAHPRGSGSSTGSTGGGRSGSRRRPPSVHVPEDDGMELDVPAENRIRSGREGEEGEAAGAAAAAAYGKRKPECSPAVTPDGPNPGQHFGDTADGSIGKGPAGAAAGQQDWRVPDPSAAKITGSRRSKGKTLTTAAAAPAARSASAAAATDDGASTAAAAGSGASRRVSDAGGRDGTAACDFENENAAVEERYRATARWRAARSASGGGGGGGGAGSRRGQPHPRGLDDSAAARGGDDNPWLATAPASTAHEHPASEDRAGRVDSNVERERRYPLSSVGIDASPSPDRGRRAGARSSSRPRAEQAWQRPEQAAPTTTTTARYHSRARFPEGACPPPAAAEQPPESSGRAVRDGMGTMSLDTGSGAGRQREEGHRISGSNSNSSSSSSSRGGRSAGDPSPYLRQQAWTVSTSATPPAGGGGRGASPPPSELPHDSIYYPGPSPASVAARRVLRAQAAASSSSSSPSRGGGAASRSASTRDLGRRTPDVVDGYTVGDEWKGGRRSRGGASASAAAQEDEDEAGCFVGGSGGSRGRGGGGRYGVSGSSRERSAAAGDQRHHREDPDLPDWPGGETMAHSRRLSSSSVTSPSAYRSIYRAQRSHSSSTYHHHLRGGTGTGARRSPSPAPLPPDSASSSWKSSSLRRALEGPTTATASLSLSSSTAGRRPPPPPPSSSSYLASKLAGERAAATAGSPASSYVPGAVAAHGFSSRGRLSSTGGGGGGRSVRSSGSVRSSSGSSFALSGSYDGQTLSSLRRSRAAQERRALEAAGGRASTAGASAAAAVRSRNAYAGAPKFY